MKVTEQSFFSTVLNAAIESSNQPPIKTPHYNLISPVHVLVALPFGLGKTSVTDQMEELGIPYKFVTDCTVPGLLGTITKEGEFVKGTGAQVANGVLILDEAHTIKNKVIKKFNSLISHGKASRQMGYPLKDIKDCGDIEKKGWQIFPSENGFELRTQFSCIWLGEKIYNWHEEAFLSRFIPLLIRASQDDAFSFMRGNPVLEFKLLRKKYKRYKGRSVMNKDVYNYLTEQFIEQHCKKVKFSGDQQGYYPRAETHLVKLAAHFARMRGSLSISRKDCDRAITFGGHLLQAYKLVKMTPLALKIIDRLRKGMGRNEIAKDLFIDPSVVTEYFYKFHKQGISLPDNGGG